jgi:mRNA interferase RelE/StbE
MLKINSSRRAEKFLRSLPKKQAKQIARKISELRFNPTPQDVKKVLNSHFLRADSGEYRIIYTVNNTDKTLEIFLIGKRNDDEIYRDLKNILS